MKLKENKKVKFFDFTHNYVMGNKVLIGVTQLMSKHGLSANYGGVSAEVLRHAAELGTAAHKCIEDYCDGKASVDNSLIRSFKKLNLNIIKTEYLISDNKIVASSIDLVEQTGEDTVTLIDMKRTSTVHKDALSWQLGIYKYLFELANPKIKVTRCCCLPIKKGNSDDINEDTCGSLVDINERSADEVKALLNAESDGVIYTPMFSHEDSGELDLYIDHESLAVLTDKVVALKAAKEQIKMIESEISDIQDAIYNTMLENNLDVISNGNVEIKLKRPYDKTSLDTKALAKEYPDIVSQFEKKTTVKGNITINIK